MTEPPCRQRHGKRERGHVGEAEDDAEVIDLMEALKRSIDKRKSGKSDSDADDAKPAQKSSGKAPAKKTAKKAAKKAPAKKTG